MSHAHAALRPQARLRLGRLVESGWSISQAAEYYRVSWPTAKRWADRYLAARIAEPDGLIGVAVMTDRSSRPARIRAGRRSRWCGRS